jgi:hypothetical protein
MTSTARDPRTQPPVFGRLRQGWTAPLTTASLATNVASAFFDYNIDFNGHADPQWGVRWQQQIYAERLFRWIPFGGDLPRRVQSAIGLETLRWLSTQSVQAQFSLCLLH